jgi:hypothetical protein
LIRAAREAVGMVSTDIGDLALIGDRRTAAILARDGTVLWYCPGRFDHPSLLAGLLDPGGGAWRIELPGAAPAGRRYLGDSGVLETHLRACGRDLTVTDWMPAGPKTPRGLVCRLFSATPNEARIVLEPRPDYGRAALSLDHRGRSVRIGGGQCRNAPLGQDQLDIAQAEAEDVVQPHGMVDDLGWEPIARIGGGLGRHPASFAHPLPSDYRPPRDNAALQPRGGAMVPMQFVLLRPAGSMIMPAGEELPRH